MVVIQQDIPSEIHPRVSPRFASEFSTRYFFLYSSRSTFWGSSKNSSWDSCRSFSRISSVVTSEILTGNPPGTSPRLSAGVIFGFQQILLDFLYHFVWKFSSISNCISSRSDLFQFKGNLAYVWASIWKCFPCYLFKNILIHQYSPNFQKEWSMKKKIFSS